MKNSVFISLLLLAAVVVGSPLSSSALEIQGVGSGRCVDINFPANFNGAPAQLWDCHGLFNQDWKYEFGAFIGPSFMCLDVKFNGTADGTPVWLYACNNTNAQNFRIDEFSRIIHVGSGKCLDAAGFGTANGTKLQIWTCTAGTNQQWRLQK